MSIIKVKLIEKIRKLLNKKENPKNKISENIYLYALNLNVNSNLNMI